ncbi:hypothetical protein ACJ41O_002126 [Fusarium nematophilum]
MAGKPSYTREEIIFVLELMVADRFNDEISSAFEGRFSRALTDNQIRYLRNKYGKDLDYGYGRGLSLFFMMNLSWNALPADPDLSVSHSAPLAHKPATGKLKRRRAAGDASLPETSHTAKRARQEVPTATPEATPKLGPPVLGHQLRLAYPTLQFPTASNPPPSQGGHNQTAGVPQGSYSLLPAGQGLITLPQASGQGQQQAANAIASWNHQPELNFSRGFQHTNIQFGQGQLGAEPPLKLSPEFQRTGVQLGQPHADPPVKLSPTFTSTGAPLAAIPSYEQKTLLGPGAEAYSPEALIHPLQPSHPAPEVQPFGLEPTAAPVAAGETLATFGDFFSNQSSAVDGSSLPQQEGEESQGLLDDEGGLAWETSLYTSGRLPLPRYHTLLCPGLGSGTASHTATSAQTG